MSNNLLIVLLVAIAAVVVYGLFFRKSGNSGSAKSPTRSQSSSRENMLQIVLSPNNACKAAQELESHRFHKNNAPTLPLANCQNPKACHCRFQMVADRRVSERRAAGEKRDSIRYEENPRRDGRGRRGEDTLFDHKTK